MWGVCVCVCMYVCMYVCEGVCVCCVCMLCVLCVCVHVHARMRAHAYQPEAAALHFLAILWSELIFKMINYNWATGSQTYHSVDLSCLCEEAQHKGGAVLHWHQAVSQSLLSVLWQHILQVTRLKFLKQKNSIQPLFYLLTFFIYK